MNGVTEVTMTPARSPTIQAPLEPFRALLAQDDARIELAQACLMIARDAYPELDVAHYLGEIERCALRLRERLANAGRAEEKLLALNEHLFGELGYVGNVDSYYDPRNSYLNDVLDRRLGIPITLAIVYLDVAERLDLPVKGVGFPGHFLLKWTTARGDMVIDPFAGGRSLTTAELDDLLRRVYGQAAPTVTAQPELLAPAGKRAILVRVLRNLKNIYLGREDRERALRTVGRILLLEPDAAQELGERARLYEGFECYRAAIVDLERLHELVSLHAPPNALREIEDALRRLRTHASSYH